MENITNSAKTLSVIYMMRCLMTIIITIALWGCASKNDSSCSGKSNPTYHVNYFEKCGSAEQPITNGNEETVTLWFEVDLPFSSNGKAWIDDIYLERSDMPGVNLLSNPSFDSNNTNWSHNENAMCLASDYFCSNLTEFTQNGIWSSDNIVFHSGPPSLAANMALLGQGYQTHIFQSPLISINGIQGGIEFRAHAYVKVEGDAQVRLGLDFREANVNPSNTLAGIRAVNGRIIQGATDWTLLNLR